MRCRHNKTLGPRTVSGLDAPAGNRQRAANGRLTPRGPRLSKILKSLCALVLLTLGAGSPLEAAVVVSSKLSSESAMLGQMIRLLLGAEGIQTVDKTRIGATPVVRQALLSGEIDLYVEYTGNAGLFFNDAGDPAWKDLERGYELGSRLDYAANRIVWLTPAHASNAWALAVRSDVAQAYHLRTMSDFGRWAAGGGLQILEDDRHDQPVYAPVPIIRESILREYPQIAAIVKPLMESLDRETLQQLNARVQINGESDEAVAVDYLKTRGWLK